MKIQSLGIDRTFLLIMIELQVDHMNTRKHIYFITISDIQRLAREKIGRTLDGVELGRVTDRLLDNIQWYDVVEEAIVDETERTRP